MFVSSAAERRAGRRDTGGGQSQEAGVVVVVKVKDVRWRVGGGNKKRAEARYGAAQLIATGGDTEQTTWLAKRLVTGQRRRMQVCKSSLSSRWAQDWTGQDRSEGSAQYGSAGLQPLPPWLRLAMLGREEKKVSHIMDGHWTLDLNGIRHGTWAQHVVLALPVGRTQTCGRWDGCMRGSPGPGVVLTC